MKATRRSGAAASLLAFCASVLCAQPSLRELPPGKWWQNRRVIQQLKLTREQQDRIEALWTANRRDLIDLKAEADRLQLDLSDLISKELVDETAALSAFDKLQAARISLERVTFRMRIQIKNILMPQQQRRLEEISERLRRERSTRINPPRARGNR